jgi:DNA helicase HerA-like ATPase
VPISNQQNFLNNNLRDAIFFGRHRGLGIIGGSQRIRGIPKNFVSQCNIIISFRLSDLNDRAYLKGKFDREELEQIGILKPYIYKSFPKDIDINNLFDKN